MALQQKVIGRWVAVQPGLEHCWPSALKANLAGQMAAEIVAAWLDKDKTLKVAVRDAHGHVGEVWLSHVRLLNEDKSDL